MHYLTGLCTFLSPKPFSRVNFHKYGKVFRDLCSVSHAKLLFFEKNILRYNCSTNRPRKWDKEIVNVILENAIPKAIIKVYFELLVVNFYAQIFCSRHSEFVKIIPYSSVYIHRMLSHQLKSFAYLRVSQIRGENNGLVQFCTTTANSKSKRVFWFWNQVLLMIFIKSVPDVFAHPSYKCSR